MIIPNKVKIGGHVLTVVQKEMVESDCGETDYEKGLIIINKNLPQTLKESTFIHEAMHVMNTTLNHELLDSLAEQMYQFLKDNLYRKPNGKSRNTRTKRKGKKGS
jgi:hypothetical protein